MKMRKGNRTAFIFCLQALAILSIFGLTEKYVDAKDNIFLLGYFSWPVLEIIKKIWESKIEEK
jgi:hypothetical protein